MYTGLTELPMFYMTYLNCFRNFQAGILSNKEGGNPLKVYLEGAKKQACNYAENGQKYVTNVFLGTYPKFTE